MPDEFQYDPMTNSYGDPTRRPEIKNSTIEFIAPAEYMVIYLSTPSIYEYLHIYSHYIIMPLRFSLVF